MIRSRRALTPAKWAQQKFQRLQSVDELGRSRAISHAIPSRSACILNQSTNLFINRIQWTWTLTRIASAPHFTWRFCRDHPSDCSTAPICLRRFPCSQLSLKPLVYSCDPIYFQCNPMLRSYVSLSSHQRTDIKMQIQRIKTYRENQFWQPVASGWFARNVIRVSLLRWACVSKWREIHSHTVATV